MHRHLLGPSLDNFLALIWGTFICSVLLITSAGAGERAMLVNANADKVAISGYDTVAYFTLAKATKGKPEFSASWREAIWHFANAEHRDLFAANPSQYAPQFGGFCAMAMTRGEARPVDPQAWAIVDGRLYLNFSDDARDEFEHDLQGNIEESEKKWAELQRQN